MRTLNRLYRDERGISFGFVGLSFLAFLCATTLAIDVGMFMTARTQAQTSADAGALAGATALVYNSFTDRSNTGPAVTGAINTAAANQVAGAPVSVKPADVEFLVDPATGASDLVQVSVYRTKARDNPVPTLMGALFGITSADVAAVATAQAGYANAMSCLLPFTVPDKWIEKQCPPEKCPFDPMVDTFEMYDSKGNPLANPDIYVPPGDPSGTAATGYNAVTDRGTQLVLKAGTGSQITPSWYNPWDINAVTGAAAYKANIAACNNTVVKMTDFLVPENGNMVGPTVQGMQGLVATDPNAYWDTNCQCVLGSNAIPPAISPRIRPIPLYNPIVMAQGQQSGKGIQLEVVNFMGFFVENIKSNGDVTGRITPVLGKIIIGGPSATGGFSQTIMLVK